MDDNDIFNFLGGAEDPPQGEESQQRMEITTEGDDPNAVVDPALNEGGAPKPESVTISKEEWDNTQQALAEMRGYMTAQKSRAPERTEEQSRQQFQPQQPVDQGAQAAALDKFAEELGNELLTDPAKGVKKLMAVAAQISQAQAAQFAQPAQTSTVDLMLENYVTRKSTKDPLFDQVEERFNQKLSKIDPRILAGYSRSQLNEALDTLYDATVGEYARERYTEQQAKRKNQRQEPTNYGGGRSSGGDQPNLRKRGVPQDWAEFARRAGLTDDDINSGMFEEVEK